MPAPVVIFAYKRPDHLRRTLEALAANELAGQSDLTIYCDGPKEGGDPAPCLAVRAVARQAKSLGFASLIVRERESNLGLSGNVISGVSETVERFGRVIVLEDDMITSPYFLRYMNEALDCYADEEAVGCIHGWLFPHTLAQTPESFFLRGGDCWGWATWDRAWKLFEPNSGKLLMEIERRGLTMRYNYDGAYDHSGLLRLDNEAKISSWAERWHGSLFLANKYTLHPGRSLVRNTGLDGSGTHCGDNDFSSMPLADAPIQLLVQAVGDNPVMYQAAVAYYLSLKTRARQGLLAKLRDRLNPAWWRARAERKSRRKERKNAGRIVWEKGYQNWQSARAAAKGYDSDDIFQKIRWAARMVRDGRALWERDSVLFYHEEYNLPLLAGLMSAAATGKGRLSVLDFGGAFGSTYMQHRAPLDRLEHLEWHIVEQPHIAACGKAEFSFGPLSFWGNMADCVATRRPDVILFSSVLQYLDDPYALAAEACAHGSAMIIIERTPFAQAGEEFTVQHVPEAIYKASYACRWLDRQRLQDILRKHGYRCLPEYPSAVDAKGFFGFIAIKNDTLSGQ